MTKPKTGLKRKRKAIDSEETVKEPEVLPPAVVKSDEPVPKKVKWINRTRVLVFAARGIHSRDRHLMKDLRASMPHSKEEFKMEKRKHLLVVNELCVAKNCNKCILLEGRLHRDLYMWIANVPNGPSAKFLVESVFTMGELKLTGNSLKGSRPLLSFDEEFNDLPHLALLKELFTQIFGTPNYHPKSQPFVDRVITFTVYDNRIWYRNYQILSEDGALAEIGPRFVLNPIKIFEGSFGGKTLWENPAYITPASHRRQLKQAVAGKYVNKLQQEEKYKIMQPKHTHPTRQENELLNASPMEVAKRIVAEKHKSKTVEQEEREKELELARFVGENREKEIIPKKEKKEIVIKKSVQKRFAKKKLSRHVHRKK